MLAASPLRTNNDGNNNNHSKGGESGDPSMDSTFSIGGGDDFPDFAGANLLDSIDFDDLFLGMQDDGNMLPDLEMDPELLAEFSLSGGEDSNNSSIENINPNEDHKCKLLKAEGLESNKEDNSKNVSLKRASSEDEIESKKETRPDPDPDPESDSTTTTVNSSFKEGEKGKKSSMNNNTVSNNSQGKRKAKVDWTPELHRRFVQAVEQLGVDKAVPSRILELMGIDCLTRHNIASHLQKYRSHRKHLLAREAEAANWTQKRQLYGVAMGGGKGGPNISPWHAPTLGFPPMSTLHHPFRPLHVWGHPTMDLQPRMPIWPKQIVPCPSPPPPPPSTWTPPPPVDQPFWNPPHHRAPNAMIPAAPCFPQPLPATRFTAPVPVPGIPSQAIYRPDHGVAAPAHPGFDTHLSKESIDAAIGDILTKPWQPLPIGLKPPSIDSVLVELQRQGVPKIPPSCS